MSFAGLGLWGAQSIGGSHGSQIYFEGAENPIRGGIVQWVDHQLLASSGFQVVECFNLEYGSIAGRQQGRSLLSF
jgi:hypothetical protein